MLASKIIGDNYQIYIKKFNKDGKDVYTFDKVDKDKVAHLCREDAKELIDSIFNTEKKYLKNENGYDIYLDKNEFKRYYKDGVEDYSMFYINNGIDATVYLSDKANEKEPRVKSFKLGKGLKILIYGVLSMSIVTAPIEQIEANTASYYKPVSYEQIKDLIYASNGLSETDKNFICNENYINFILDICDNPYKSYDLYDRFSDINVEIFDPAENVSYVGCYINNTSNIRIINTIDKDFRKNVLGHEFSHLCQANFKYRIITEAFAEIMSYEFLDCPKDAYLPFVYQTKILIEILGTKPVINAAYSIDTTLFEDAVRQFLEPSEANEFLNLLSSYYYQEYDNEIIRINELLEIMIENKYKQTNNKAEKELNTTLMEQILAGNAQERVYFNQNNPNFYKKLIIDISEEFIKRIEGTYNNEVITSKGIPKNIRINNINYNKEKILANIDNTDFSNFLKKFERFSIYVPGEDENESRLAYTYEFTEKKLIKKTCYDEYGNIKATFNLYSDSVFINNLKETLSSNNIEFINFSPGSKVVDISWHDFNIHYVPKESIKATIYYDNYIGELDPLGFSLYKSQKLEIPSYYEKTAATVINKPSKYIYLENAIKEIFDYEYYGEQNITNISGINNVKCLMEFFGPKLIYSACYNNDNYIFEESIRKYLDENKTKDFLRLLTFNNYEDITLLTEVNEKIYHYINEIKNNRIMIEHNSQKTDFTTEMLSEIYKNGAIDRFYFNKNDERYYKTYDIDKTYEYKSEKIKSGYNESLILSHGTPESIYITSAKLNKDKFIKLIENPKYYDFIKNNCDKVYTNIYTVEGNEIIDLFNYKKNDGGFVRNNNYDKQIRDFTDKKYIPDYTSFKNDLLDFLNNTDIEINNIVLDFRACPLSLDELNSLSFLLTDKYSITFKYDDTHYAYITYNKDDTDDLYTYFSEIRQLQIPSIPETFGEIDNSYTDDTNTINKAK